MMKKVSAFLLTMALMLGVAGCGGAAGPATPETPKIPKHIETESPETVIPETEIVAEPETETEVVTETEIEEDAGTHLTDPITLDVYLTDEPHFESEMSSLEISMTVTMDGQEILPEYEGDTAVYYAPDGTTLAMMQYMAQYDVLIQIYDTCAVYNVDACTGPMNESLELLQADAVVNGQKTTIYYSEHAYRSYTGVWLFGIAQIVNGQLGPYDASWMQ